MAYIYNTGGVKYMQSTSMSVSVTTPITIGTIIPNQATDLVGATTNLQLPITFPAPFLPGSIFTLTFTNIDVSGATILTSSSIIGNIFTRTSTSMTFNLDNSLYTSSVSLTSLIVQNIVNNVVLSNEG